MPSLQKPQKSAVLTNWTVTAIHDFGLLIGPCGMLARKGDTMTVKLRNKTTVERAKPRSGADGRLADSFLWDDTIKGFGLKVTPIGRKVFVYQYRLPGSRTMRRFTIGELGTDVDGLPLTPDRAHRIALRLQQRVGDGKDPMGERKAA